MLSNNEEAIGNRFQKPGEKVITRKSSTKPRDLLLTSALWMTGFFFVASALCGAHAEQPNPAKTKTFGYIANANDNTISVIATDDKAIVATIPVGEFRTRVATTPDGTRVYVRNFGNTVSVIATANNTVVATIPVGNGGLNIGTGVAITPNGTRAYVANALDQSARGFAIVSVIDTASNTVVATIPVGDNPVGVAITPYGTNRFEDDYRRHQPFVYVTNDSDGTVSVIDTTSNTVVATIPVGNGSSGVAVTPDATHAYVTNSFDNTVSVIDTARNKVVAAIPVGNFPSAVAFGTVPQSPTMNH